ncbi:hypothetical protein CLV59_102581 [Chitinophaga dinghuensis]|uniref:Uncharacterized protein n=1 Tax=Chitinophaga dinghuensis TaxID=1539050 RepID=A0A327W8B5_9BACT|nr:hypothetical protein [Chitinophaga dinghuensis]RAJ85874.1 hypothetical protein CLV59_102581 [Chitinophaga dinghuensis]
MEHQESSIFEDKAFKSAIVKGKAYPNIGQLFMLLPVALGLLIIMAIIRAIIIIFILGETGMDHLEHPDLKTSTISNALLLSGLMIGLLFFMYWKKKKTEPAFIIKIEKPDILLLAKVGLTIFVSYITIILLGTFITPSPLAVTLNLYDMELSILGMPLTIILFALIMPVVNSLVVYSLGYDGLLKNYPYKRLLIFGVIGSGLLFLLPAFILLSLPFSILYFLIFYKSQNVLYVIIPSIVLQLAIIITILLVGDANLREFPSSIPIWISGMIAIIAGLCWYVLLQDLRKMEHPYLIAAIE